MTRFEIAITWLAGLWLFIVLTQSEHLYRLGFYWFWDIDSNSFIHAALIVWIPLILLAVTRRFWR